MNQQTIQERFRWASLAVGLALVFGPFQNCTIYESPDRKTMNEEGFPTDASCDPYITQTKAAEIMGSTSVKVTFLSPDTVPLTCSVSIPGTAAKGNASFRCTFSETNAARARGTPPTVAEGLIGTPQTTGPEKYFTYANQETSSSGLTTYIITVGAYDGRREGVRCGATFDGDPPQADKDTAQRISVALVREMIKNAP